MLGFAFSLIGEVLTGKGALGQLGYELFDDKLNIEQIDVLVVGLILFNLVRGGPRRKAFNLSSFACA